MANTYSQIYIQAVFAVKFREAVLDKSIRKTVFSWIGNLINETGCKTIIVNGVEDHVHCFFTLKPTISVSELMKIVKGKSSKYINDNKLTQHHFEWQEGYSAFSYSQSQVQSVYKYIANQEEHHKTLKLKEEHSNLLEKFEVPFDQKFIFEDLK